MLKSPINDRQASVAIFIFKVFALLSVKALTLLPQSRKGIDAFKCACNLFAILFCILRNDVLLSVLHGCVNDCGSLLR